ncbi:hypothetical protein BAU15_09720 [Enterococcus sp. JM4C]|uniref:hypothetical protein n=1 Tax=Candidatus Enterococcus huntleyi TaxID=1857217 RepID=UPI00137ADF49|nr:hypothetical protein [Enterococcus sp. JM4C]KAF1298116.1 hypothetical protein BAU15_09720 [Enterococcus sp. JM4C]
MKKKLKKKLLTQFRPSMDAIRTKLLHSMEEKIAAQYGRTFKLEVEKKEKLFLVIQPEKESGEERILIPIDDNFTAILKKIQTGDQTVFDTFRDKLLLEVLSIWGQHRAPLSPISTEKEQTTADMSQVKQEAATKATSKKAQGKKNDGDKVTHTKTKTTTPTEKAETPKATETVESPSAGAPITLAEFKEAIARDYSKLFVEETDNTITINEQAAAGPKLLASLSKTETDSVIIEKALERKYKVKLTLIPLIEALANTPIDKR